MIMEDTADMEDMEDTADMEDMEDTADMAARPHHQEDTDNQCGG
jgi:hypothetical protein